MSLRRNAGRGAARTNGPHPTPEVGMRGPYCAARIPQTCSPGPPYQRDSRYPSIIPLTSEDALVQQLLARDSRAMTLFYQQYRVDLRAAVLRIVRHRENAEDVVQESMLKIWQSSASYDAAQGRLFTRTAKIRCNTTIDHVRTGCFRLTAHTASLDDAPDLAHAATPGFQPAHIGVPELLHGLRPEYRQVMELLYLQGYIQLETADEMQVPLGTIKTWAGRARYLLTRQPL